MKRKKFKEILNEMNNTKNIIKDYILKESDEQIKTDKKSEIDEDADPKELSLDSIIVVSQELKDGNIKKFDFSICEVWLKPDNVWTIVNVKKDKVEKNFWILFYDNGTYYLKKGIKGPIGVHVTLKYSSEE